MPKLRDVTREFSRGEAPLDTLRAAAKKEIMDRQLADALLQLIAEWESSTTARSAWSRNDLRERAEKLIPAGPPPRERREDPTAAMYGAGFRGHHRTTT